MKTKRFKVVSVSSNHNSFGLRGMILIAEDGDTWEVAANDINVKPKGSVVNVPHIGDLHRDGYLNWSGFGFEIPRRLGQAPIPVIEEAWNPSS